MKKRPNILIVGSFVLDNIATTSVFPKQGETVIGEKMTQAPGGKGANQAVQIARLGGNVTMVGKLGMDSAGDLMKKVLEQAGVNTDHILRDANCNSGCAFVILEKQPDGSTLNRIIVIPGTNMQIKPDEIAFLKEKIHEYDMLILQHEIPMEINRIMCRYAQEAGVKVMLNPAPSAQIPDEILSSLAYISPNEVEASNMTDIDVKVDGKVSLDKVKEVAQKLNRDGVKNVLITLGSLGAMFFNGNEFIFSPGVKNTLAADPTAAGDSFVGAFCTAICAGISDEDALVFANHTAALTVSKVGAMPSLPTLNEVEILLAKDGIKIQGLDCLKG